MVAVREIEQKRAADVLAEVVGQFGVPGDARRLRSLLADHLGSEAQRCRPEIDALVTGLAAGLPSRLSATPPAPPNELSATLVNAGADSAASAWVVRAWASSLGVTVPAAASPTTPTTPPQSGGVTRPAWPRRAKAAVWLLVLLLCLSLAGLGATSAELARWRRLSPVSAETIWGADLSGEYRLAGRPVSCTLSDCRRIGSRTLYLTISDCAGSRCAATERSNWVGDVALTFDGAAWRGSGTLTDAASFTCERRPYRTSFSLELIVDQAAFAAGAWHAQTVHGRFTMSTDQGQCTAVEVVYELT